MHLLKGMFRPGKRYVKVGIILTDLVPTSEVQLDLFSNQNSEKHSKLMHTVDTLRQRFGHQALKYAVQGNKKESAVEEEKRAAWMLQKRFLSSLYTTSVEGLLHVKAYQKPLPARSGFWYREVCSLFNCLLFCRCFSSRCFS